MATWVFLKGLVRFIAMVTIGKSPKNPCYHHCMGTINQQSVREEAERIKIEFGRLSTEKKINSETKMLIQSMFMLINLLIAIFLEKTTKKNNKNSSKPSSQTEKDESALTKEGTNGKGKQESNAVANNT